MPEESKERRGRVGYKGSRNNITVIERLASAVHSHDLSHKSGKCDVDYLQGLAIASKHNVLGSVLIDLDLKHESRDVVVALNAVMETIRNLAEKNNWQMNPRKCRRLATDAINIYLRPICTCCKGQGNDRS